MAVLFVYKAVEGEYFFITHEKKLPEISVRVHHLLATKDAQCFVHSS
jgi:hypothetical protein